jgi:hypothetical protein
MNKIHIVLTYLSTKVNTSVSEIPWLWEGYDSSMVVWIDGG